jgi:Hydrophobic surface binding protein A
MRLSILLPLSALSSSVLADGASILAALGTISNATVALNSSITAFRAHGDPLKLIPILIQATTLLSDINDSTKTASASANLTVDETLTVAGATLNLVSTVETTLDNIVAGENLFNLELVSPVIYLNLVQEKTATDKFSAAVISKVPEALQSTAQSIIAPIDAAFIAAISAFKGKL